MALRQGQRHVRVEIAHINSYLYNRVKIEGKKETVVGASVEGDEVVFLVERVDEEKA